MSRLLSRVLLAILMFPIASMAYLTTFIVLDDMDYASYREELYFMLAGGLTWLIVAAYWFALWRTSVQWTTRRIGGTVIATAAAVVGAIVVGVLLWSVDEGFATFVGSVVAPLLWLVGTIFVWRDDGGSASTTTGEAASVVCPACGYSMTGLRESRCPECGSRYTLDALYAGQPQQRATAELK